MSKILEAIAFAAADECERYSLANWYERSARAETALGCLSDYLNTLEITPEEHDTFVKKSVAVCNAVRHEAVVYIPAAGNVKYSCG